MINTAIGDQAVLEIILDLVKSLDAGSLPETLAK
jgi:hypothetical protein